MTMLSDIFIPSMKIISLSISNFKNVRDQIDVDFKPITLFVGPNSSGKSTIIQALHYLKEIFVNRNCDADVSFAYDGKIRFGGFKNIVNNHDFNNKIILGVKLKNSIDPNLFGPDELKIDVCSDPIYDLIGYAKNIFIEISVSWDTSEKKPIIDSYALFLDHQMIIKLEYFVDIKKTLLTYFDSNHKIFQNNIFSSESKIRTNKTLSFKSVFKKYFSTYFNNQDNTYDYEIGNIAVDYTLPRDMIGYSFLVRGDDGNTQYPRRLKENSFENVNLNFAEISPLGKPSQSERDFKKEGDPRDIELFEGAVLDSLLNRSVSIVRQEIKMFLRIGPLREIPQRIEMNQKPHENRFITGKAAWDLLYSADDEFLKKFNHWISSEHRFNTGYMAYNKKFVEVDVDAIADNTVYKINNLPVYNKLIFRDITTNIELMPQDVGFGFSQILPVIVAALMGKKEMEKIGLLISKSHGKLQKGILSIEQPELHIHPALQVECGDLFILQTLQNDILFLIETHSEHLILRILKRIRENYENKFYSKSANFCKDDIAIYFVESKDGSLQTKKINIDNDGEFIDPWPYGFFQERAKEIF